MDSSKFSLVCASHAAVPPSVGACPAGDYGFSRAIARRACSHIIAYISALVLVFLTSLTQAQPVNLTPDQIAQLENLSPDQRAALINSGATPTTAQQEQIAELVNIEPRAATSAALNADAIEDNAQLAQQVDSLAQDVAIQTTAAEPLQQFGYELFAGSPTTFAPATNIPVPASYVMGPGDTVVIQLYGQRNLTYELVITREGMLMFPEIGPVSVAGLNFDEMRAQLQNIVATQLIGQNASITLGALRSINVFVLGEAFRPGSYTVSSLSTMTNALFVSGGITRVGSLRNIRLMRSGELITELDLYDLLLQGDTSRDTRLLPGDVIFIPPVGQTVGIAGEVKRPAIYELKNEVRVDQALALAGGFLPTAFPRASRIDRINELGERTVLDVDLSAQATSFPSIADGDVIQIFSILDQVESVVRLEGHVHRPGSFQWRDGLRVSDVVRSIDEMLPNPDLEYALIAREVQPTRRIEMIYVNLGAAIGNPGSAEDLQFQPRDQLFTFGAAQNRQSQVGALLGLLRQQATFDQPPQIVAINGNVRFPGEYPLVRGMDVNDLVKFAAGLGTSTDLDYVLLQRSIDRSGSIEVQATSFDPATLETRSSIALQPQDQVFVFNANGAREGLLGGTLNQLRSQAIFRQAPEIVSVAGNVRFPGEYPLHRGIQLADLLKASGGLTEDADISYVLLEREINENHDIKVVKVDIDLNTLQPLEPFHLQPRDRLVIFSTNSSREILLESSLSKLRQQADTDNPTQIVSVVGNVRFPGNYPLVDSLSVGDLIQIAGGLTESAESRQAEITRYDAEPAVGREIDHLPIDLTNDSGGNGLAAKLGPYDQLVVRQMPNWTTYERVFIDGEVNSPGTYSIAKEDTLSSLIARAGGLTQYADPRAAIFLREELRENEQGMLNEFRGRLQRDIITRNLQNQGEENATVDSGEVSQLLAMIEQAQATGRLVIDLPAVIEDGSQSVASDVILRDGDRLLIPRTQQEISVIGEVNRATSHLYNRSNSVSDYIAQSGGYTSSADQKNVFIIKATGEVMSYGGARWFFENGERLEPGDTIIVPFETRQIGYMALWRNISQILFNASTSLLAIERVGN